MIPVKIRKKQKHPESDLQQACVRWYRYQFSKYSRLLFAIPNGGRRSKAEASILIGEGVISGVADLFLSKSNKEFHGLYIEMKIPGKYQTKDQVDFELLVISEGYKYILCKSIEQFISEVTKYLS